MTQSELRDTILGLQEVQLDIDKMYRKGEKYQNLKRIKNSGVIETEDGTLDLTAAQITQIETKLSNILSNAETLLTTIQTKIAAL